MIDRAAEEEAAQRRAAQAQHQYQHPPATPKIERVGEMRRRPGDGGTQVSSNVHPIWARGPLSVCGTGKSEGWCALHLRDRGVRSWAKQLHKCCTSQ